MTKRALVVVDLQRDFCEGGSLGVEGGNDVAGRIADYLETHRVDYEIVVFSQDWHIAPGAHFDTDPDFDSSFPAHCRAGTSGARLHHKVEPLVAEGDLIVRKGQYSGAFSAFEGSIESLKMSLVEALREKGITEVCICGLATDFCVCATALDAHKAGFRTILLNGLSAPVSKEGGRRAFGELETAGVVLDTIPKDASNLTPSP